MKAGRDRILVVRFFECSIKNTHFNTYDLGILRTFIVLFNQVVML